MTQCSYIVRSSTPPWGDHGRILMHGMSAHQLRAEGVIQLERSGPFIPPITFPGVGDVVVTSAFRSALESSGLLGVSFRRVDKVRVVRIEWERWDRSQRMPHVIPESGEPSDYILERTHDPKASKEIRELWELVAPVSDAGTRNRMLQPGDRPSTSIALSPDGGNVDVPEKFAWSKGGKVRARRGRKA